ncbi:hypothetical protein FACS1894110_16590 [Spirochaetia bacterium]|nr:hypothetical protein FACS1894110_16590 [Spirochaetia bacterium]
MIDDDDGGSYVDPTEYHIAEDGSIVYKYDPEIIRARNKIKMDAWIAEKEKQVAAKKRMDEFLAGLAKKYPFAWHTLSHRKVE